MDSDLAAMRRCVVEVGARELDAPDDCAPVVAVLSARVPVVEDADVLEALGDVRAVVELRLFFTAWPVDPRREELARQSVERHAPRASQPAPWARARSRRLVSSPSRNQYLHKSTHGTAPRRRARTSTDLSRVKVFSEFKFGQETECFWVTFYEEGRKSP